MADELQHKDPGSALTQAEYITTDGTGHIFDSQAQGDILYATSTTVLSRLGKSGTSTHSLTNTGTNNNPAWAQVALATGVSGTLPVANGGTGATTLTDKAVLISQDSGTDTLGSVALTTSGQVIIGGSSGPAAATLTAGSNVTITNGDGSISIAAGGGPAQAEESDIEDETNEDTYIPPDLAKHIKGAAKFWCDVLLAGSLTGTDYNVASITDTGTGDRTVVYTTAMAEANYPVSVTNRGLSNYAAVPYSESHTTANCVVKIRRTESSYVLHDERNSIVGFGLA